MADTKLTALPTITSVSIDDLMYVVDDPGGSPTSSSITFDLMQRSITAIGVLTTDVSVPTANSVYIGPSGADGSWRFSESSGTLSIQKRESGTWVEKGAVAP